MASEPDRAPVLHRRYKRHQIEFGDGKLVLHQSGTIEQLDPEGATVGSWKPGDDGWEAHALRFGLRPRPETTVPPGRREGTPRPK